MKSVYPYRSRERARKGPPEREHTRSVGGRVDRGALPCAPRRAEDARTALAGHHGVAVRWRVLRRPPVQRRRRWGRAAAEAACKEHPADRHVQCRASSVGEDGATTGGAVRRGGGACTSVVRAAAAAPRERCSLRRGVGVGAGAGRGARGSHGGHGYVHADACT